MPLNKKKTIFCCYDAGSAELLLCYLSNNFSSMKNFTFFIKGPAKKIFLKKFTELKCESNINYLKNYQSIVCSTGWSNFNFKIMNYALTNNKQLISIVDQDNYFNERFFFHEKLLVPNIVWGINFSKIKLFFRNKTNCTINFLSLKNERKKYYLKFRNSNLNSEYLLVAGNAFKSFSKKISSDKNNLILTKKKIVEDIKKILKYNKKIRYIVLRPHPKEKFLSFQKLAIETQCRISVSKNLLLENDLQLCKYVLSYSKAAAIAAKYVGNKVYQ